MLIFSCLNNRTYLRSLIVFTVFQINIYNCTITSNKQFFSEELSRANRLKLYHHSLARALTEVHMGWHSNSPCGKPLLIQSTSFRSISSNQQLASDRSGVLRKEWREQIMLLSNLWDKHRGLSQFLEGGCHRQ